jgi:HD-like signal output (HDOD) protein
MQRFVQQLAADLSTPGLQLPSYPEVALRVQRVLSDVNASGERVLRVLAGDPVLAARILALANSAAMNTTGKSVTDLRAAIARMGFDSLRTAAIGLALAQLRKAADYRPIERPMTSLWHESVHAAAMGFVVARQSRRFPPETAMLAGLVSGVGKLYMLTRSSQYPALFASPVAYRELEQQWHAQVARGILESWKLAPSIVEAVGDVDEAPQDDRTRSSLADVLATSQLLIKHQKAPAEFDAALPTHNSARRLELTSATCASLLQESATEIQALREALAR